MNDGKRTGPGRPPLTGERFIRMQVNVPRDMHAALAGAAEQRATTVSGLVRQIVADWMRHEMPIGHTPLTETPDSKETPRD